MSKESTAISDPDERVRIEQFMNGGGIVMATGRKAVDVLDPDRGRVVPMIFRTDGEWVWAKSMSYYLMEHDVPLDTEFLNHIRSCQYISAMPDEMQIQQAIRLLQEAGGS